MKLAILIILFSNLLLSQSEIGHDEIGHNNFGTEFYLTVPPNLSMINQSHKEFINFIFFSPFNANATIEIPGRGLKNSIKVPANQTIGMKFEVNKVQPFLKTGFVDFYYDVIVQNSAIVIKSDYPISVLVQSDFENTTDAYLAIPKENLGKEYVVSSYTDASEKYNGFLSLKSNSLIVATEDDTEVEFFYPADNTPADVRGPLISGETFKRKLDKGDIWIMSSVMAYDDLSNARIKSNKPISVFSSNQCANVPVTNQFCDFMMNMEIPIEYWGKSYIISKYSFKKFGPVIRIYAAENNTKIYNNGDFIGEIKDVYDKEIASFIELERPLESFFKPFIISSDKPIMVTSYNTGDEEDLRREPNGGPFMMSLPSIESMTKYISVSSPNFPQDINFHDNYVNLLFELDESNDIPESFEIGYIFGDRIKWEKIKDNSIVSSAQKINIPYNNKIYGVLNLKLPNTGHFKFRSDYKFTMINYGVSDVKSYGFQSNINLVSNQGIDTIAPVIEWEPTCDSKIIGKIYEENLKHNLLIPDSNLTNLKVLDRSKNPSDFEIEIIDKKKPASGTIKVWDVYGNIAEEKVFYSPQDISVFPNKIVLNTKKNTPTSSTFSIKNNSKEDFTLSKLHCDIKELEFYINQNKLTEESIILKPTDEIIIEAKIMFEKDTSIVSDIIIGNDCLERPLIRFRIDVQSSIIEVKDIVFQDGVIGQKPELVKNVTIYNRSDVPLNLYMLIYPNYNDFEVYNFPLMSKQSPFTLQGGQSISGKVKLISNKKGQIFDSLKVISDAEEFDSICYITANQLEPGVVSTNYNFGKKLIHHKFNNIKPYKSEEMVITNYGQFDIKIVDLEVVNSKNGEAFKFDKNKIIGKELKPNENINYIVEYLPKEVGEHYLELNVILDKGYKSYSNIKLSGFGTRPIVDIIDTLDFGKVQIVTGEKTLIQDIKNISKDWEYGDTLKNYNFEYDINLASDFGFFFFNPNLDFVAPGESVKNYVTFKPNKIGKFELPVYFRSNGLGDTLVYLIGEGIESKIKINKDYTNAEACEGEKDTIIVVIENQGQSDVVIEPIRFEPILPEFIFLDNKYTDDEFILGMNEKIEIPIEFHSFGQDKLSNIVIKEKTKIDENKIQIEGKNKKYENEFEIKPIKQLVEVSHPAISSVVLEDNIELKSVNLTDLTLIVNYDPGKLNFESNSIRLGNNLSSNYIIDNINKIENGRVQFDLISLSGNKIENGGELVSFLFNTYLSNEEKNSSEVVIELHSKTTQCINFNTNEPQVIETVLDCSGEFRKVESNVVPFYIDKITPNPLDKNINLTYAIPFDSNVEISLIDLTGNRVKQYVNSYKSKGYHEFELNIDNLSNGQYYLRVISSNNSKNIPLIISK